jgi:hypothetical protein
MTWDRLQHYSSNREEPKPIRQWLILQLSLGAAAWGIIAIGVIYLV